MRDPDTESSAGGSQNPERRGAGETPGDDDHLADVPDGCGCAEVWEHLSDHRE